MTTSENMTFDRLHEGIEPNRCLTFDNQIENTTDYFFRMVNNAPPVDDDFRSFYEEGVPLRPGSGHKNLCDHRCVSLFKIQNNEEKLRKKLSEMIKNKPALPTRLSKVKFRAKAGLVWYSPSQSSYIGDYHHNLMKCDSFSVQHNVDVVDTSEALR